MPHIVHNDRLYPGWGLRMPALFAPNFPMFNLQVEVDLSIMTPEVGLTYIYSHINHTLPIEFYNQGQPLPYPFWGMGSPSLNGPALMEVLHYSAFIWHNFKIFNRQFFQLSPLSSSPPLVSYVSPFWLLRIPC